ncbi:TonB-dependent receptor [Myroides injenensis]|uniref:hypothetical protein n=1 Tax=Myroides injenensis TaxID=1183151 RepID=UPI00226FD50F|nr:hypothetical protein [Myroides injenensis]
MKFKALFFLIAFYHTALFAQTSSVRIDFTDQVLTSDALGRISTAVEIVNDSYQIWEGQLFLSSSSKAVKLNSVLEKTIVLQPGQRLYIPILAQADMLSSYASKPKIFAKLVDRNTKFVQQIEVKIEIQKNRKIILVANNNDLQYQQLGDTLSFEAHIINKGNTVEKLSLAMSYPKELVREKTESTSLYLKPQQDTLITFKKTINKEVFREDDFEVYALLLYANGDFINRIVYNVSGLKEHRKYKSIRDPNEINVNDNQIEVNRVMGKNVLSSYQLRAKAQVELRETSKIGLATDILYWDEEAQWHLRQLLLEYQDKKWDVQAGNIYQVGEFSVQGRGARVAYKLSDSLVLNAGVLDKTYLITDPSDRSIGYNAWIGFDSYKNRWNQSKLYYDVTNRYNEKRTLWFNSFSLLDTPNFRMQFQQGVSYTASDNTDKYGAYTGVSANAILGQFQFQTNSFYSTPYYGGIRQGVTQLNNTLRWSKDKTGINLSYQYIDFNPKYTYPTYFLSKQESSSVGLNFTYRMSNFYWTLAPRYMQEKRPDYKTGELISLESYRAAIGGNYANFNKQYGINANLEIGKYQNISLLDKTFSMRSFIGANYKTFDLGVSYQYNYSNLSEFINSSYLPQDTYTNFMFIANYRQRFVNEKLGIQLNSYYTDSKTFSSLWQSNARVDYRLNQSFEIYASGYTTYGGLYNKEYTYYLQLGAIAKFNAIRSYIKSFDLKILVYYQNENNDLIAAGNTIVRVGKKSFLTNEDGIITYKRLPLDTYEIQVKNDKNWYAAPVTIVLDNNMVQEIVLTQTATIQGSIKYIQIDKSFDIIKMLGNQRILAQDELGRRFTAYTSDNGDFVLYVPKGIYHISLYPDNTNYVNVLNNNIVIDMKNKRLSTHIFEILVKEREVKTKKFEAIEF